MYKFKSNTIASKRRGSQTSAPVGTTSYKQIHYAYGRVGRGVTRLVGARGKKQVWRPLLRTWGLSEANAQYWRKYLWHCWDFPPPSAVIWRSSGDSAPDSDSSPGEFYSPFPPSVRPWE